jgi:hypothetical protein
LERAARMRGSGDEAHARLADGLARDWAEVARDSVFSATTEEKAHATQREMLDASAGVDRERALLEEAIARVGRLRARLEETRKERAAPDARAANDAGAK